MKIFEKSFYVFSTILVTCAACNVLVTTGIQWRRWELERMEKMEQLEWNRKWRDDQIEKFLREHTPHEAKNRTII